MSQYIVVVIASGRPGNQTLISRAKHICCCVNVCESVLVVLFKLLRTFAGRPMDLEVIKGFAPPPTHTHTEHAEHLLEANIKQSPESNSVKMRGATPLV